MEDLLKDILKWVLADALLTPGEQEKKRLMKLAAAGAAPEADRAASLCYQLGYLVLLPGALFVASRHEATLLRYGACYLAGALVIECLFYLYTLVVRRSEWQVLASRAIKRDTRGRVTGYRSARYRWLLRAWGVGFIIAGVLA